MDFSDLAAKIWPLIEPKVRAIGVSSAVGVGTVESGAPSPHTLSGGHHNGTLADAQAPQFLKLDGSRALTGNLPVAAGVSIDGVDLSAHVADAAAHHNPVSAGDGIGVAGQVVSLDPPSTLSASTTNNVTASSHTHAITSTYDGSTNVNRILRSGPSGQLYLSALTVTDVFAPGSIEIQPVGDIILDPGGHDVLPGATIDDDLGDYNRMWRTLFAAELYVETLVAQDVLATIGGRIMVAPTTKLIANLSSGASTMDVEHNNLSNGGFAILKTAPGGVAQFEAVKITSGPTTISGGYRYSISRNQDGTGANSWVAGDAVAYTGDAIGEGYIELTSTQTVHNHLGPAITIYSRTGTGSWDDVAPVAAFGNLESFVDYSTPEIGDAFGNDLTLTPTTGFKGVTNDRTNGPRLFSTRFASYNGATQTVLIDSNGDVKIGQNIAANSSTAFRVDAASGDAWLGDIDNANVMWDKSAGQLKFRDGSTVHAYVDTDGTLKAGDGAVELSSSGINIDSSNDYWTQDASISFVTSSGDMAGNLWGYNDGYGSANVFLESGGDGETGEVNIYARNSSGGIQAYIDVGYSGIRIGKSTGSGTCDIYIPTRITDELTVDTRTQIGSFTNSTDAAFAHTSHDNLSNYALRQTSAGITLLNSASGQRTELRVNNTSILKAYSGYVEVEQPLRIDGYDTITNNPITAASNVGWKMSLYGYLYAIGVASGTLALRSDNWVAAFDGVNPANSGSPDNNACWAVNQYYMWVKGSLGEAWNSASLNSGWSNYSSSWNVASYKKVGDMVFIRGMVKASSSSSSGIIFTLPSGYYDSGDQSMFIVLSNGGSQGYNRITINGSGQVVCDDVGDATTWLNLDGINFFSGIGGPGMASSLGITVGVLSSTKKYEDDEQVQKVLLEFGEIRGLFSPGMSNQEKLDAIVEYLEAHILQHVHRYRRDVAASEAEAEIEAEYALK